jgi:hypothetical protein
MLMPDPVCVLICINKSKILLIFYFFKGKKEKKKCGANIGAPEKRHERKNLAWT